jgi:amino acid transporter
VVKRVILGRAMRSDNLGETLLPKRLALPVFASDALSSVAYAPDEIFLTLGLAGGALALTHSWEIALSVVVVMAVVIASYRQNVRAYPSGGGDYEVASVNLGPKAGLGVGSALLVDYVLTVAVSISAGVQNAAAAFGFVRGHEALVAVLVIAVLTAMNLRGVRESGTAFAIPTYLFMATVLGMALIGVVRRVTGSLPPAESAGLELLPDPGHDAITGLALAFLFLRAFSSGCAALTGVEAISNGVPAFRKPKSQNAATTLLLMGCISVTMMLSMVALATWTGVKYAEDPAVQLARDGVLVGEDYEQHTVMVQVAQSVFSGFPAGVVLVSIVTGLILVLAANTAFNGFPVLGSILARDGFLPRQLHTRGDRLAFSNGIIILAAAAALLVVIYDAKVTAHPALHRRGVRVVHPQPDRDGAALDPPPRLERNAAERGRMMRSRVINGRRRRDVRHGAARRARDEVRARRGLRHRRDGRPLPPDDPHPPPLRPRARRAERARGRHQGADAAVTGARHRARLQDPQADPAGRRLRPGHPPDDPRGV